MNRKCIIIAAPSEGKDFLPGTLVDLKNYKNHLKSIKGGAWYEDEIISINTQGMSDDEINKTITYRLNQLREADYAMFAFTGHGCMLNNKTTLYLSNSLIATDSCIELYLPSKASMLFDCCREIQSITEARLEKFSATFDHREISVSEARRIFEDKIGKANKGHVKLYGCKENECCNEDSILGGFYSSSLLQAGRACSIRVAHNIATIEVQRRTNRRQNPQDRSDKTDFPFILY